MLTGDVNNNGSLTLNEIVQKEIQIDFGNLQVTKDDQPLTKDVSLRIGTITGMGVFNGRLTLQPSSTKPRINGTFNGIVEGNADFSIGYENQPKHTVFNAENTYDGITEVQYGTVDVNSAHGLGVLTWGTAVVNTGTLNVNAPTPEPMIVRERGRI